MSITSNIISAILKSVVEAKMGNGLASEVLGISIDGISEKGIKKINDFIESEKVNIENILSKEYMQSMNISETNINYVIAEIKDLFSGINISDYMFRQCKYDSMKLSTLLWNRYYEQRNHYIECESEIKQCLFVVANVLTRLVYESDNFVKEVLMQLSYSSDDIREEIQSISKDIEKKYDNLDVDIQNILDILRMILEYTRQEKENNIILKNKFQNNKKDKYIESWNSRLFLHLDNNENPITLADAFIMPDCKVHKSIKEIGFSNNDELDERIEKFFKYDKTSTLLIIGVPGIGKSTITSWIANKYKDDNHVMILRFRDWEYEELEKGLLKAIYNMMRCKKEDLENKILIIDGFDEMKTLDIRNSLLDDFFNDINDFDNFKCIITSRPAYIYSLHFNNVLYLQNFDIKKIKIFYKKIMGNELKEEESFRSNIEILGIPVILYMAIMSNIDIDKNPTRPELYSKIFAENGGIFDKFSDGRVEYSKGAQILRNPDNIKKYLKFLSEVGFNMFQTRSLILQKDKCKIPELKFRGKNISILEFPIKHLFEGTENKIEFVHKTIYEYFVSEYIINFVTNMMDNAKSKEELASELGKRMVEVKNFPAEIRDFIEYKITNKLEDKFSFVHETFQLMLQDGMTFYTNICYKNAIDCEMNVFENMLKLLRLWKKSDFKIEVPICYYMKYNKRFRVNLKETDMKKVNLEEADLSKLNLMETSLIGINLAKANLCEINLKKANLTGANLIGVNLEKAILVRTNFYKANLTKAKLFGADLQEANLMKADLQEADLTNANLNASIWEETNIKNMASQLRKSVFSYVIIGDSDSLKRMYRDELFQN